MAHHVCQLARGDFATSTSSMTELRQPSRCSFVVVVVHCSPPFAVVCAVVMRIVSNGPSIGEVEIDHELVGDLFQRLLHVRHSHWGGKSKRGGGFEQRLGGHGRRAGLGDEFFDADPLLGEGSSELQRNMIARELGL